MSKPVQHCDSPAGVSIHAGVIPHTKPLGNPLPPVRLPQFVLRACFLSIIDWYIWSISHKQDVGTQNSWTTTPVHPAMARAHTSTSGFRWNITRVRHVLIFLFPKTMTFLQYRFSTYKNIYYKPLVFSSCKNTRNFRNNTGLSTGTKTPSYLGQGWLSRRWGMANRLEGTRSLWAAF